MTNSNSIDRVALVSIEVQTKGFIKILDDFALNSESDKLIESTLRYLDKYTVCFEAEEVIMKDISYAHAKQHQAHHHFFIQELRQFQLDYRIKNTTLGPRLFLFMKKWLVSHIQAEHAQLIEMITEHGNKVDTCSDSEV
ncbi:hemerythrin domain-containing protein [Carboxylicivirga sp. M1479]|uniref:hemerythrin domain-containing protein n=1 Tax=Carboxylicivirga sp. M1479 TaxID=2594476 RepID=UPI00117754C4|nr:hemerythrin domain-containing protein [Carboxylicivirga sp. M1479]TRX62372.1 hypothetical protein FNN09_19655 [Carboxylicivirga sp. M1479]